MHPIIAYQATKERLAGGHQTAERGRKKHRRRIVLNNLATVLAPRVRAALTARSHGSASLRPRPGGQGHVLTNPISASNAVRMQRQRENTAWAGS
jgi:hypothetical protein